jgi:enoyl-CoA hydratase/carnithine racemase
VPTGVSIEVDDAVAVVTLDAAEARNVFSGETARQLSAAYAECDRDDAIRAVVLTGAGDCFCAGADLSPEAASFAAPGEGFSASPVRPPAWEVRKLVVAAVNGHAIGIGFTLALQCDLLYVAESARLAIRQPRLGMVGDAQSHWTLPRRAGAQVAADLLLTGRTITGAEAAARGVAVEALPADRVLATALEVATSVSPASVALSKRILWGDHTAAEVERLETDAHRVLMAHDDAREGPAAWRERRTPAWGLRVGDLPWPASPSRPGPA